MDVLYRLDTNICRCIATPSATSRSGQHTTQLRAAPGWCTPRQSVCLFSRCVPRMRLSILTTQQCSPNSTTILLLTSVALLQLLYTWTASADVMAVSTTEYNLGKLGPGDCTTIKWRGKPVFIRHLTGDEIAAVENQDQGELRDPATHSERVQKPEWSIILGICTHLGCVPISKAGDWQGYFCPCHGSHYDASGRIMKGPAPENMVGFTHHSQSHCQLRI